MMYQSITNHLTHTKPTTSPSPSSNFVCSIVLEFMSSDNNEGRLRDPGDWWLGKRQGSTKMFKF